MTKIKSGLKQINFAKTAILLVITMLAIFLPALAGAGFAKSAIPKVKLSVKPLDLMRTPTMNELMAAGQLGGQLYPTSDIKSAGALKMSAAKPGEKGGENVNLSFGRAIQAWNEHAYKKGVALFKKHLEEYPDSPWAAEADLHIGCDARYNGRYTEAEEVFTKIINDYSDNEYDGAQKLVNKARQRLSVLKVLQNNLEEAKNQFGKLIVYSDDWRMRTYASHWIQRLNRMGKDKLALLNCGAKALAVLLEKEGRKKEARQVTAMSAPTVKGYSLNDIQSLAREYGYELVGLRLAVDELAQLPLPAILQLSGRNPGDSGHYWVLEKAEPERLTLFDPQSGRRFHQKPDAFDQEWDGIALVYQQEALTNNNDLPGILLSDDEIGKFYGGCCGSPRFEDDLGNPGQNGNRGVNNACSNSNAHGAPVWSVNMISMNFYMLDIPLWYNPPIGPSVNIALSFNSQSAINNHEPFGNKWQFNYGSYLVVDTNGSATIFMPDGRRDLFVSDGAGGYIRPYQVYNTLTQINANRFELRTPMNTTFIYDIPAGTSSIQSFLIEIRDAYGQSLTFGYENYEDSVLLTTITDALNRQTILTYNDSGLVTQVKDPFGRSAKFEYDSNHNLTAITDMGGYRTELSYDDNVYLKSLGNERGIWNFYTEPSEDTGEDAPLPGEAMWGNYRITVTNPLGGKEEYFYDGNFGDVSRRSWYIKPRDYVPWDNQDNNNFSDSIPKTLYSSKSVASGQKGELSRIDFSHGDNVRYKFDSITGLRTEVIGDYYNVVYTYNDMGRITSVNNGMAATVYLTYAANQVDVQEISMGDLGAITMTYNDKHSVTSITDRLGHKTVYTYNAYGQITSVNQAQNELDVITTYTYDPETHNLLQIVKDGNIMATFTYDAVGRIRTRTDGAGLTLTYDYNDLNHITQIAYPDGKSMDYEYSDCCPRLLNSITDRRGRTTYFRYDALKRMIEMVNPDSTLMKYDYDANGNMIKFTDASGNSTVYEYDLNDRPIKKIYADGKAFTFAYDGMSRLIQRTDSKGITTKYTYDNRSNLTYIDYSDDTPDAAFYYDSYNHMTRSSLSNTDNIHYTYFTYDANSQLVKANETTKIGNMHWEHNTLEYEYDALGRVTDIKPDTGDELVYTYDNLNRLAGVQVGENHYNYTYANASPLVQTLTRPNGSVTSYQYDALNRLTEIANLNSSDAIINRYAYTYNEQDLRNSETVTNGNPITSFTEKMITYDYNIVNQLLSATNPEQVFEYDANGNMTKGYTPEGYVFTAAYDGEDRLSTIQYTDNGGVVHKTEYRYSGDSLLARKIEYADETVINDTRFIRSGFLPIQERDADNTIVREYAWGAGMGGGIGGLLNLKQGGQDYAYLYDGKGNVTALIDNAQAVVAAYTYDPFGNLKVKTGALEQPYQFSTKSYDFKTGLSYYGYRFYAPVLGRWMNRDPLGESGGINLYGFVQNDPVNFIDPFGLTLSCPTKPPPLGKDWKEYSGWTWLFHCSYDCFIENRDPSPDNIGGECCYNKGQLVDENDPWAGCRGTNNEYPWYHPGHWTIDEGGIVKSGPEALKTTIEKEMHDVQSEGKKFIEFIEFVKDPLKEYQKTGW